MAIIFNDNTGLTAEDASTIRAAVASDWQEAFAVDENTPTLNTEPETPAGQLVDGMTALIVMKDNEVLKLGNMFNPLTATGIYQDALGKIYFIDRLVAQATVVTCTCMGLPGTVIPQGSIVEDSAGNQYTSLAAATIGSNNSVSVVFSCTTPGPVQVNSSTVNKIVTVIPGWDSVTNPAAGVTGRLAETQTEFETRRYASVAKNSHGLSESVGGSIANLTDVVASKIVQNRTGEQVTILGVAVPAHSVYLSVYGGTPEEIGQVIYNKLDAGCGTAGNTSVTVTDPVNGSQNVFYYTVPDVTNVYVQVTTAPDAVYDETNIVNAILNNFNGGSTYPKAIMGETIYASRFYQDIISAGLSELVQVEVSLTSGSGFGLSCDINLNQIPVLSAENISFVEADTV